MRRVMIPWPDRLLSVAVMASSALLVALFAWILADLLVQGLPQLSWAFLFEAPRLAGRAGGIGPILYSTVLTLAVCLALALPVGLGCAMLLAEFSRQQQGYSQLIRRSLDVLAGMPSIVFGLFGNAFFCIYLGLGYSILAGGLTLACMILPILIRATEEGFRSVSQEQRLAAAALSLSATTTLLRVLLPAALPGVVVGVILGLGRAMAETAALLFTSGYVDRWPQSLLDSGRTLSVHIYDLAMNVAGGNANAYASALVLVGCLLVINLIANWVIRRTLGTRGVGA